MPKLTLTEIALTPEFLSLNKKQKLFVATYVQNGLDNDTYDAITAVRTAYKCKDDVSARAMTYRLMQNVAIAMCLSMHFGEDPQEAFLNQLARDIIKGRVTQAIVSAYRLYANIKGWHNTSFDKAEARAELVLPGRTKDLKVRLASEMLRHQRRKALGLKPACQMEDKGNFDLSAFETDN